MPKRLDVTVEQLKSIYGQLYDQLEEKASLHLPAEGDGEQLATSPDDVVRREVQLQLQDFLTQVMDMASSSLRVTNANEDVKNMRDLIMKSQEKYVEPFDLELNEKVRQKYEEWEDQTVKVSQLRQNGPREINHLYNSAKQKYLDELDSRISQLQGTPEESHDPLPSEELAIERSSDPWPALEARHRESLQNLHLAQQRIPNTRSDINKIHALVKYLESELN